MQRSLAVLLAGLMVLGSDGPALAGCSAFGPRPGQIAVRTEPLLTQALDAPLLLPFNAPLESHRLRARHLLMLGIATLAATGAAIFAPHFFARHSLLLLSLAGAVPVLWTLLPVSQQRGPTPLISPLDVKYTQVGKMIRGLSTQRHHDAGQQELRNFIAAETDSPEARENFRLAAAQLNVTLLSSANLARRVVFEMLKELLAKQGQRRVEREGDPPITAAEYILYNFLVSMVLPWPPGMQAALKKDYDKVFTELRWLPEEDETFLRERPRMGRALFGPLLKVLRESGQADAVAGRMDYLFQILSRRNPTFYNTEELGHVRKLMRPLANPEAPRAEDQQNRQEAAPAVAEIAADLQLTTHLLGEYARASQIPPDSTEKLLARADSFAIDPAGALRRAMQDWLITRNQIQHPLTEQLILTLHRIYRRLPARPATETGPLKAGDPFPGQAAEWRITHLKLFPTSQSMRFDLEYEVGKDRQLTRTLTASVDDLVQIHGWTIDAALATLAHVEALALVETRVTKRKLARATGGKGTKEPAATPSEARPEDRSLDVFPAPIRKLIIALEGVEGIDNIKMPLPSLQATALFATVQKNGKVVGHLILAPMPKNGRYRLQLFLDLTQVGESFAPPAELGRLADALRVWSPRGRGKTATVWPEQRSSENYASPAGVMAIMEFWEDIIRPEDPWGTYQDAAKKYKVRMDAMDKAADIYLGKRLTPKPPSGTKARASAIMTVAAYALAAVAYRDGPEGVRALAQTLASYWPWLVGSFGALLYVWIWQKIIRPRQLLRHTHFGDLSTLKWYLDSRLRQTKTSSQKLDLEGVNPLTGEKISIRAAYPVDWHRIKTFLQDHTGPPGVNPRYNLFKILAFPHENLFLIQIMTRFATDFQALAIQTAKSPTGELISEIHIPLTENNRIRIFVMPPDSSIRRSMPMTDHQSAMAAAEILNKVTSSDDDQFAGSPAAIKRLKERLRSSDEGMKRVFTFGAKEIFSVTYSAGGQIESFDQDQEEDYRISFKGEEILQIQTPEGTFIVSAVDPRDPQRIKIQMLPSIVLFLFGLLGTSGLFMPARPASTPLLSAA